MAGGDGRERVAHDFGPAVVVGHVEVERRSSSDGSQGTGVYTLALTPSSRRGFDAVAVGRHGLPLRRGHGIPPVSEVTFGLWFG